MTVLNSGLNFTDKDLADAETYQKKVLLRSEYIKKLNAEDAKFMDNINEKLDALKSSLAIEKDKIHSRYDSLKFTGEIEADYKHIADEIMAKMAQKLQETECEFEQAEQEMKDLDKELAELQAQIDQENAAINEGYTPGNDIAEIEKKLESLEAEETLIDDQIEELNCQMAMKKVVDNCIALEQEHNTMEIEVQHLEDRNKRLVREIEEDKKELEMLQYQVNMLRTSLQNPFVMPTPIHPTRPQFLPPKIPSRFTNNKLTSVRDLTDKKPILPLVQEKKEVMQQSQQSKKDEKPVIKQQQLQRNIKLSLFDESMDDDFEQSFWGSEA